MEGKTNFSRRLKQFDGLTLLTATPLFYDRSAPLLSVSRMMMSIGGEDIQHPTITAVRDSLQTVESNRIVKFSLSAFRLYSR